MDYLQEKFDDVEIAMDALFVCLHDVDQDDDEYGKIEVAVCGILRQAINLLKGIGQKLVYVDGKIRNVKM